MTSIVLDTSVIINLNACSFGEQILKAIPNNIVVPNIVMSELTRDNCDIKSEKKFIQKLASQGLVKITGLNESGYKMFESLVSSPVSLDDGEAATIAAAYSQGHSPVIDERKGRATAESLMNGIVPLWSLDILTHPKVATTLTREDQVLAIYRALRDGRMRICNDRCQEVVELIGIERALDCTSLPQFKRLNIEWEGRLLSKSTKYRS